MTAKNNTQLQLYI